jgi:hypothetical protein
MPSCKSWTQRRKNVIAGLWLAWVTVLIAQQSYAEDKVTDIHTFPNIPIKEFHNKVLPGSVANDRKVLLGSAGSDLWRGPKDPRDEFWMVTDRGPNGLIKVDGTNRRTFLVPEFNPMILRVKTQGQEVGILEALPIVGQSGKPVTGLPNLTGINETPYNYSAQEPLNFNPNGLDTEGLIRTTAGDFWIAEEYGPSLVHVDRTGKVLKRYIPAGLKLGDTDYPVADVLPAIFGKTKINRGFEGLALSNDEKTLYTVLQSPLLNPDRKTGNASRNTRVLVFDIATERVTAEYVYRFDVSSEFDRNLKNSPDEMKLSGVVFLNPTTLLVLERTDSVAKLYSVDISKATNILNTRWDDAKTAPALEALDDPALAQVRVLPKSLLLDLSSLYGMPEKIEGIALLDRHTIAVVNDNDFGSGESRYDDEVPGSGKGTKTQILIISLSKPLPLPLDSVAAR